MLRSTFNVFISFQEDNDVYFSLQKTGSVPSKEDQQKQSYICPTCPSSETLFSSYSQWLKHKCAAGSDGSTKKASKGKKRKQQQNGDSDSGASSPKVAVAIRESNDDVEFTVERDGGEAEEIQGYQLNNFGNNNKKRFACPYCVGR